MAHAAETVRRRTRTDVEEKRSAETFRSRLAAGRYDQLLGEELGAIVRQAAAERGVATELGALRYVMARLLVEVEDPIELATAVARVASASVAAARAQRSITGDTAEALTEAVADILSALDGDVRARA